MHAEQVEERDIKDTKPHKWLKRSGPHGLGDPDDKSLRKVEENIVIPKKIRDKSRTEKCIPEVEAFTECGKQYNLLSFAMCRKENKVLLGCLEKWFYDKEFNEECKQEYLRERSEYRRTGISTKARKHMKAHQASEL